MAASANDKFMKAGYGTATTLSAPGYTSGVSTTINVASTATWPTTTGVYFAIDEAEVVDGEEVRVDGTYNIFRGTVNSATSINNVDYVGGDAERSYSAGALTRVYILSSSYLWNNAIDGLLVSLGQDGHIATTGVASFADHIDVVDGKAIRDGNDNELVKFSETASAVNEVTIKNAATGNAPQLQATGGDTNIDVNIVPKGTGEVTKAGNPIDWWEELGRTTLGSAGDTVSVTGLPARKYLKIQFRLLNSGSVNVQLQFNTDTGSNYSYNNSIDGAASGTATSQGGYLVSGSGSTRVWGQAEVISVASEAKLITSFAVKSTGSASATPIITSGGGAWGNTSNAITSVQLTNGSTGDYAIGSEVVVLGHD